mgnify:CR=1 FL=1
MKKCLFLCLALCIAILSGCNAVSVGIIGGADGPTKIIVSDHENNHESKSLKIVDGVKDGKLILAGNNKDDVYYLNSDGITVLIDGKKATPNDLQDGMPVDVFFDNKFENPSQQKNGITDITSFCHNINGYSMGTERNPGGSCYDLSGLYLKVLEDLWKTDEGLNGNIKYISVDLSKAPGELTDGEKSAISYIFANTHEKECLQFSYEELIENGYLTGDKPYYFEDGVLFSIKENTSVTSIHNGLIKINFNAQKWRSGTGAYIFTNCTASWPQMGTWKDYKIGGQAIS